MARSVLVTITTVLLTGCALVFSTDVLTSETGLDAAISIPRQNDDAASTADAPSSGSETGGLADGGAPDPLPLFDAGPQIFDGAYFVDDFHRPSSPTIGNGWSEKTDVAWELVNNLALKVGSGSGYKDNLVFRPDRELANVEIAEELVAVKVPTRSTSLHVRIQPGSVVNANTLDSYCAYIFEDQKLVVCRQRGAAAPAEELSSTMFPPLAEGTTYRLKLEVFDSDGKPVVAATLERRIGPKIELVVALVGADPSADPLEKGFVGFSADVNADRSIALTRFEARTR